MMTITKPFKNEILIFPVILIIKFRIKLKFDNIYTVHVIFHE